MKKIIRGVGIKIGIFAMGACVLGFFLGSFHCARTTDAPQQMAKANAAVPNSGGSISWQDGFASVASRDLPAVVNISSSKTARSQMIPFFDDPFFSNFSVDNSKSRGNKGQKAWAPELL